ncbi:transmembrane protease serine 9-like [Drosophila kikkawai]|uniref:trypsin n=1 Tax=Drosophila kikkawai TaxID=30033 RepID=A0ABM4GCN9_DROKI
MNKVLLPIIAGLLLLLLLGVEAHPQTDLNGRIVGGSDTSSFYTKYVVQLRRRSSNSSAYAQTCGGCILDKDTIVTAAHCVYNRLAENFLVVAGSDNIGSMDGVVVRVEKLIPHELYNATTTDNDIALVKVTPSLPLATYAAMEAIELSTEEPKVGATATISGWGYTTEGGRSSNQLQQVTVPIVDSAKCQEAYYWRPISEAMICAGVSAGGRDACQGDSGGPLVVNGKLAGIVSWGEGCARPNYPGVYANVAYFNEWITNTSAKSRPVISLIRTSRPDKSTESAVTMCIPQPQLIMPFLLLLVLAIGVSSEGSVQPQPRIINGTTVDVARHPYIVSLRYRRDVEDSYKHECAGVIYSEHVLLTAAQCLHNLAAETKLLAVVGANTRTGPDGIIYPVANWTHHKNFDYYTADYDIGVLFLDTPLNLSHFGISKVGIRPERPAVGRLATVAGWGYREEWGPSSNNLEQTQVPVVGTEQCNEIYGAGEVTERMICAGYVTEGGSDACQGDTGGPLVIDNQLVGLVSWGRGCARPNYPTVYTYVASFLAWIEEIIAAGGAQ